MGTASLSAELQACMLRLAQTPQRCNLHLLAKQPRSTEHCDGHVIEHLQVVQVHTVCLLSSRDRTVAARATCPQQTATGRAAAVRHCDKVSVS
jgi:hypothetical protein